MYEDARVSVPEIQRIEAQFRETINPVASLGFVGLATDRASLPDFRAFVGDVDGVEVHATRIPFAPVASPETLACLIDDVAAGVEMLVPGQPLGSISFSCTSGTVAVGEDRLRAEIASVRPGVSSVTPIGAAVDGLRLLGCSRLSLLMPYLLDTSRMVAGHFEDAGFALDRVSTFDLNGDPEMNCVDPDRIITAALEIFDPESDGLFISCTGWLTRSVIEPLEDALGVPVVTSNQALAWSALRAAGVIGPLANRGQLFCLPTPIVQ